MKVQRRNSIFLKRNQDFQRSMRLIKKTSDLESPKKPSRPVVTPLKQQSHQKEEEKEQKHMESMGPLNQVIKKVHVQQKVRQFISKLKRNNFSNQMKVAIEHHDQHVQTFMEKVEDINSQADMKQTQGLVLNPKLNMCISLISFLAVVIMQVISSFACFLYQFRELQFGTTWLLTTEYICLIWAFIKMMRNFITIKSIHGYRMTMLQKLFLDYLYSLQFCMDFLFFFSLMLMISRPFSTITPYSTYVISLIVILITPRIDEIIVSHIHVSNTTRQYLALVRLLLANLFFNHIMGTLYMLIADTSPTNNWMIKYGIQNNYWFSKYLYSLYFAVSITTTAALGDVSPANNRQALLTTLMMLYGCLVLSYNISQMTTIFTNLSQMRQQLEKELQVLQRLAEVSQIRNQLHREMANYLVHSNESKFQYQIQQRKSLIMKLPENLRAQYLQQNSHSFFKNMPFFSILRPQSKKILAQTFILEISSPGQYLTHKKEGLQKVIILRMGTVGLAYNKKNSTLNSMILDKICIQNDEKDVPVLLNTFLFNRRKQINYSIICETFCTIASLDYETLMSSLRSHQTDYQFWRQFHDSDQALQEQWSTKECKECKEYHIMFNCPKLTYMPLRSLIYMKYTSGKYILRKEQIASQKEFQEAHASFMREQRKRKSKQASISPLKFWKSIFAPYQKMREINLQKYYYYYSQNYSQNTKKLKKARLQLFEDEFEFNQCDVPYDFDHYFKGGNPGNLFQNNLGFKKNKIRNKLLN